MAREKEYRVHRLGGTQGNYIVSDSKQDAIASTAKYQGRPQKVYRAMLWKVNNKLTNPARKKMKLK